MPTPWTCASSPPGAPATAPTCSRRAGPTSNALAATWKTRAGPGPRSPGACAPWPASTATPWRRNSWTHSPAVHVRRPRLDYESHATALDRNELGALLVAAGLGPAPEHALISLLALNGLRVSEALGADIDALGLERGHRTLTILRKGGKIVTIPLAPRTARASTSPSANDCDGPIFLAADGQRLDRHGAARIVHRVARRAGITKPVGPHTLRHAFITAALDAGVPSRRPRSRLATPTPAPPCATTGPASPSTATPPTSSPPSSPEPPDSSWLDAPGWVLPPSPPPPTTPATTHHELPSPHCRRYERLTRSCLPLV